MYITFEEVKARGEGTLALLRQNPNPELDFEFGFNHETVKWIDSFIERKGKFFSEESQWGVAVSYGYIVGETLIRDCGGAWEYSEDQDQWLVNLGAVGSANPIGKVYKCLRGDYVTGDSILGLFDFIRTVVEKGGIDQLRLSSTPPTDENR